MNAKYAIIVALIMIAAVLGGCSGITGKAAENSEIKIGVLSPLTGEAAVSYGQNVIAGATLAAKEINERGGINGKKVKLIVEDDQCSSKGANAVQKLINYDDVLAILGPVCSASGGPALPIAQENKIPVVIIASAPNLAKIGDYIFRVYPSDALQGKAGTEFIYKELGKRNVALIYVKNDYGEGLKDVFETRFKALGGNIVYVSGVLQTDTDFKTEIMKIKDSGTDVIYLAVYPTNAVQFIKQAKETNLNILIVGAETVSAGEVVDSGYADGVICSVLKVGLNSSFDDKLHQLNGFENLNIMPAFAPVSYDGAMALFSAIEKAGTDRAAIRDALQNTSFQGVSNYIEFDEDGDLKSSEYVFKVIKDKGFVDYSKEAK